MYQTLPASFLLSLLLWATAFATPLVKRNGDYSKIHRQATYGTNPRNGTLAFIRTYRKYNWALPVQTNEHVSTTPDSKSSSSSASGKSAVAAGSGSGSVVATPEVHNSEYLCPVTIGGQTLNLDVDTGSSDLWVFNTALPKSDTENRTLYDPSKSETYSNVAGATFSVNYGDGSQTYGNVGVDTVEVGGVTVMGQALELPTAISSSFTDDLNSDGILGLGFQSSNGVRPEAQPTFFENALSSLKAPVFTANLKANTAGNYQFGIIDHTAYTGEISYVPVNKSSGLWQFETKKGYSPGIADTGSSLLLLDDPIVQDYWKQVPSHTSDQQGIIFPCGTQLPDFHIELGSTYVATVAGSLINYAPATSKAGYCFGGIQSNNGQQLNIFGDILFASQFAVFDAGNMRIGFAPHAA
ncbi:hypothetical protein ACLMJK_003351 [Lecanora helva]